MRMLNAGRLFVFEGPDGVGKSTLAAKFFEHLVERGIDCAHLTFPGHEPGTLGHLVYQLHHVPNELGLTAVPPASLQLLHVAAHLDAIETRIRPLIDAGTTVVLDRFWWSTWVYGLVSGVNRGTLEGMIALERRHWGSLVPSALFLLTRPAPLRDEGPSQRWQRLAIAYAELAASERTNYPVYVVPNVANQEQSLDRILLMIADVIDTR